LTRQGQITGSESSSRKERLNHQQEFRAGDDRHRVQFDAAEKVRVRPVTVECLTYLHYVHHTADIMTTTKQTLSKLLFSHVWLYWQWFWGLLASRAAPQTWPFPVPFIIATFFPPYNFGTEIRTLYSKSEGVIFTTMTTADRWNVGLSATRQFKCI